MCVCSKISFCLWAQAYTKNTQLYPFFTVKIIESSHFKLVYETKQATNKSFVDQFQILIVIISFAKYCKIIQIIASQSICIKSVNIAVNDL